MTLLILITWGSVAGAAGSTQVMLILDGSGSMWGQIDGKAKIAIAKEVMTALIADLPDDLNVGLTAYGHRRKGDCRDVEQLVPVTAVDKSALKAAIAKLSPRGKTPIAHTLMDAATQFKQLKGNRIIILVTDGLESCDGDPCRVAQELAEAGVVAKIHIVGFDLTGEAMAQLQCIAQPSQGLVVSAGSAGELKAALGKVMTASVGHNLIVHGIDGAKKPLYVQVRVLANGREVAAQSNQHARFSLPPGTYTIEVTHPDTGQVVTLADIAVTKDAVVEKDALFADGKIRIKAVNDAGENLYVSVTAFRAGTREEISGTSTTHPVLTLLQGNYDIRVYCDDTQSEAWLRGVIVKAGEEQDKEVLFTFGEVLVHVLGPDNAAHYASVRALKPGTDEEVYGASSANARLILPPGTYDIEVYSMDLYKTIRLRSVVVTGGATLEKTVRFQAEPKP
jgi:Ca-activated chloride channel family protein